MSSNVDKYKTELEDLIYDGELLLHTMQFECYPEEFDKELKKTLKTDKKIKDFKTKIVKSFGSKYQSWYSEGLAVIKLLLPDRVEDFVKLYEKPKNRKELQVSNYVIEDYLQGLSVTRSYSGEEVVGPSAAIPQFQVQLNILKSAKKRFTSSLFDIKQLLQADLFDSELEVAEELNGKGFTRGAGAIAGVVLELHLTQVSGSHNIKINKKDPNISYLNDLLKKHKVIEQPDWRFIQRLGDLRNKCDHKQKDDPTKEEVKELISGVGKIIKTLF